MALVNIFGLTNVCSLDSGRITQWTTLEFISGLMVENIKDFIKKTVSMALVSINGLMESLIKDGGIKVNNMAQGFLEIKRGSKKQEYGSKARKNNGLLNKSYSKQKMGSLNLTIYLRKKMKAV